MSNSDNNGSNPKVMKDYEFGGIEEFDLEKIQNEVLNDSVYLDVFAGSEPSFKQGIEALSPETASSVLKLNTYKFEYDRQTFKDKNFPAGHKLGLMADEVEKFFPECIATDEDGYRHVNYSMLVAPLLETVKQLEKKVSELEKKLKG